MANPTVKAFAIYLEGKKAFTCNQQSISFPSGRTATFGQEGYLAHSKGAMQTRLTLNEITPVGGSDMTKLLQTYHMTQRDVPVAMLVGGKIMSVDMAITNLDFGSGTENGVATGTGTFEGGVPTITG
jgi:hypothetical protein